MTPLLLLFAATVQHGVRVPDGFEVTLYADHTVANDIHCLTVGPGGEIVVSGRGYVRQLVGNDRAEKVLPFAAAPKDGAMGLFWDKGDLYVVGDGGLRRYRGRTKPSEVVFKCKTGGEHMAHAVQRGPDGWLYLMVGDGAGIAAKDVTLKTSPVKDPIGGCVLRFPPDFNGVEVYAHGFRNAYGMDFGPDGGLYTFDSDNERCVGLPWYEPCRFYRVERGGHHGWLGPNLAATWRLPPYFPDVVPPLATLGRGSPTGVVIYKHASFPARYRGGAFLCDWTFGVVHFVPDGGKPEAFLKAVGGEGFAPTAAAVHPKTGDLYVSVGGRGTRGGVYRIRHTEGVKKIDAAEVKRLQPRAAPPPPAVRTVDARLAAVRKTQLELGGPPSPSARGTVWEGYTRSGTGPVPAKVRESLRAAFPSGDPRLDFELARALAMAEDDDPAVAKAVLAKLGDAKDPAADIHYLACLGRLRGRFDARKVADALLALDANLDAVGQRRDSNWPLRIAEIHAALAAREPALNEALLKSGHFGRPEHVLFTRAKGFDRAKAAERFLGRKDLTWNDEIVRLVAGLPAERSVPALRELWGTAGVDDAILPVLARHATAGDRDKLLTGLTSARLALVAGVLTGLERLPPDKSEIVPLLRSLRQLPAGKEGDALRKRLTARLEKATGRTEADLDAWLAWARKAYPDRAAALANLDGVDVEAWRGRLAKIDWAKGDAARGAAVFTKASCAACHSGAAALGPDLAGVTKRFSRDDLLTAIVQPSKDVSERYRTTRIVTGKGVVHQGIIVYEAVDGVILLTGRAATVRVPDVASKSLSPLSLMPSGLLDRLSDGEIADLLAHLAALR